MWTWAEVSVWYICTRQEQMLLHLREAPKDCGESVYVLWKWAELQMRLVAHFVWKETDQALSYRSKLIYGQRVIGWPGDQALGDTVGKSKIREDMYTHLFEELLPLSGMFFPSSSHDFSSFRRTVFRIQRVLLDPCCTPLSNSSAQCKIATMPK